MVIEPYSSSSLLSFFE